MCLRWPVPWPVFVFSLSYLRTCRVLGSLSVRLAGPRDAAAPRPLLSVQALPVHPVGGCVLCGLLAGLDPVGVCLGLCPWCSLVAPLSVSLRRCTLNLLGLWPGFLSPWSAASSPVCVSGLLCVRGFPARACFSRAVVLRVRSSAFFASVLVRFFDRGAFRLPHRGALRVSFWRSGGPRGRSCAPRPRRCRVSSCWSSSWWEVVLLSLARGQEPSG